MNPARFMACVKAAENHPAVEYRICLRERKAASDACRQAPPSEQDAAYALFRKVDTMMRRRLETYGAAMYSNQKRAGFDG